MLLRRTHLRALALTLAVGASLAPAPARAADDASALERTGLERESKLDYGASFDAYAKAFQLASKAPEGEVYLYKLQFLALKTGRQAELGTLLEQALSAGLPPFAEARARFLLSQCRHSAGDVAGAEKVLAPLGLIGSFAVAGPFDNERGGGFSTAYDPESGPIDLGAHYHGKGREIGWMVPPAAFLGHVDLDGMLRPNDEALAYALTYVKWEGEPATLALRVGSDEGVKAWWNGDQVLSRDVNRNLEPDQEAVGVAVRKGWNRLLLKITERKGAWGFVARLTALDGTPLAKPLVADPRAPAEEVAADAAAKAEKPAAPPARGAIDEYERLAKEDKLSAQEWFRLGYLRFRRRAHDESEHPDREAYEKACAADEKSAVYRVYLSFVSAQSGEFSVNREENARRFELEKAVALDPQNARALQLLADYYLRSMRIPEKAAAFADRALAAAPGAPEAVVLRAEIEEQQGLAPLARARLLALEKDPRALRSPEALRAVARAKAAVGDAAGARKLHEAALALDRTDDAARSRLVSAKKDMGDLEGALALLAEGERLEPLGVDARLERAALLVGMDRFDDAAAAIESALAICPAADDAIAQRGRVLLRVGKRAAAIDDFEHALTLNPNLVDIRRYLEFLKDAEKPFENEFRMDADEAIAAAAKTPLDREVATRVLLENTVVKVNPDGTSAEFDQRVLRVENDDGVEENRWYSTPYSVGEQKATILRATLVKKNGRREEARIDNYGGGFGGDSGEFSSYSQRSVELPTAEVGDMLILERRVEDLKQSFFGDYFGTTHFFQGLEPIERSRFTLIAPANRELYFNPKMLDVKPEEKKSADGQMIVRTWEKSSMPRIEQEPNMPPLEEVAPSIQVSTFRDWNAFSKWYWNLVRKQQEVSEEMRVKIKELIAGKTTREEKIRAIYNFVVTDVRYNDKWEFGVHGFKPYNASSIFTRRFGDCKDKATLIITMLGEVGVPAYPVLIEGVSERGNEDYTLPLMDHFNHCIAYAPGPNPDGSEGWFLDGTAQHHEATNLPNMDFGATVLIIRPDGGELKKVKWPDPLKENGINEMHHVLLKPDGGATVGSEINPGGVYSTVVRQAFENPGQRKELLEKIYGRHFAGARVVEESFGDLRSLDDPVRVRFKLEVPQLLKQSAGGYAIEEVPSVLFQWIYVDEVSKWAAKSERKYDVVLPVPSGCEETIEYTVPEGWSIKTTPPEVKLDNEFGTFVKTYEQHGRTLKVTRKLVVRAQRIPVARYAEWRAFANEIDRADDERAILGKGGPVQ